MSSIQIDKTDGLPLSMPMKGPVRAATSNNIALYGRQTIDGVAIVDGDRVLVKAQTADYENGIYIVDTGQWRRAKDFNKTADVRKGTQVLVTEGATSATTFWFVSSENPIVVGTDDIEFTQKIVSTAELATLVQQAQAARDPAAETAEAATSSAGAEAAFVGNNWTVDAFTPNGVLTDFALSNDPGSPANVFVNLNGVAQLHAEFTLIYPSGVPTIHFLTPPPTVPNGGEFSYGNAVAIGVPGDGTVSPAKLSGITTDNIPEGALQYFTNVRVRSVILTGLSTATNVAVVAADTILVAIGKLQAQITAGAGSVLGTALTGLSTATNAVISASDTVLSAFGKLQAQITASQSNFQTGNIKTNSALVGAQNNGAFIGSHDTFQIALGAFSGGAAVQHLGASGAAVPVAIDFLNAAAVRSGYIAIGASSVSYSSTSDYRLKDIVSDYTVSGDFFDAVKIYNYTWKDTGEDGVGVIAHELQVIFPHAVQGAKDATTTYEDANGEEVASPLYQGVDYSKLVPVLIAEVQSLRARISTLENAKAVA